MHRAICTLWRVRTVAFEASECNALGNRERGRDGGNGEDGHSEKEEEEEGGWVGLERGAVDNVVD